MGQQPSRQNTCWSSSSTSASINCILTPEGPGSINGPKEQLLRCRSSIGALTSSLALRMAVWSLLIDIVSRCCCDE